jgi:ankyrin repeat protein
MKILRNIRWMGALSVVLVLSLFLAVKHRISAAAKEKPLTRTEKELLFRENGLLKDHFFGYTQMILASLNGDLAGVTKALADGGEVNWKMEWGYTALMLAADQGHLEIVKLLVEKGADPKMVNDDGVTALELARREGRSDVVTHLVSITRKHR